MKRWRRLLVLVAMAVGLWSGTLVGAIQFWSKGNQETPPTQGGRSAQRVGSSAGGLKDWVGSTAGRVKGWVGSTAGRVKGWVGSTAGRVKGWFAGRPSGGRQKRASSVTEDSVPISSKVKDILDRFIGEGSSSSDGEKRLWVVLVKNRNDFLYDMELKEALKGELIGEPPGPNISASNEKEPPGPNISASNEKEPPGPNISASNEKEPLPVLHYRTATDLFVLNDDSPLFHPDFFFPLAVMANLSLERTWSSRAGGLLLRRKYAPRWEAFMKPLLKFVDRLSDSGLLIQKNGMPGGEQPPELAAFLDGTCGGLDSLGLEEHKLAGVKVVKDNILALKRQHLAFYGADPGLPGEWTWEHSRNLGLSHAGCAFLKWSLTWDAAEQSRLGSMSKLELMKYLSAKLQTVAESSDDLIMALDAMAGFPHRFLTRLSKDLPRGWKFKTGLFSRASAYLRWMITVAGMHLAWQR